MFPSIYSNEWHSFQKKNKLKNKSLFLQNVYVAENEYFLFINYMDIKLMKLRFKFIAPFLKKKFSTETDSAQYFTNLLTQYAISLTKDYVYFSNLQIFTFEHILKTKNFSFEIDFLQITLNYMNSIATIESKKYPNFINLIFSYINENIYEKLTVSAVAQHFHKNKYYLSKLIKKTTGYTLQEYIIQQKIVEAEHLLRYSEISLSQIAHLLHFYDNSYFTKTFKKHLQTTPTEYRNENRFIYHIE